MKTLAEVIAIGLNIITSVANAIAQASAGTLTPDEALAQMAKAIQEDKAVDARVDAALDAKFPKTPALLLAAGLALGLMFTPRAYAQSTREVLVLTTVTTITFSKGMTDAELYNNGDNTIWCAINAVPVTGKCRPVAAGAAWTLPINGDASVVKCLTSVSQTTTHGTSVSESVQK